MASEVEAHTQGIMDNPFKDRSTNIVDYLLEQHFPASTQHTRLIRIQTYEIQAFFGK